MNKDALERVRKWLQLAQKEGYCVKLLASACGVSVRGFERFFRNAEGEPPRGCLKRLRMERALELLHDGCNVNQTADRLGYHDHSHFSRDFKKHYGLAPKEYGKALEKGSPTRALSHLATKLSHSATKR